MTRNAPLVHTRRFLGSAAIVAMLAATLSSHPFEAQASAEAAGAAAGSSDARSNVEALGTQTLTANSVRDAARADAVSRARALQAEAAQAKVALAAAPTVPTAPEQASVLPSDQTILVRRQRITGHLSPKSIVASPSGLVTAQNMMYSHTISVFTPDGKLTDTVADSVDLSAFGIDGHPGISKGAPVEAAFTHDGKYLYASNYSMYGKNFGPEGKDVCTPATAADKSFVYRIDAATLKIDQVIPVGSVPKYVAVSPDDSTVLVTNWCSQTVSMIDVTTAKLVETIPVGGAYPRGIAISGDSKTAFVAVMGAQRIIKIDLASQKVSTFARTGNGPRHILISPDGNYLYVTNNTSGTVSKVDAATGEVLKTVTTGDEPRSMAISSDGLAIYIVNYKSSTVSKLRTSDLTTIDKTATDAHPIGITYEPTTGSVWVACYGGSILIYSDSKPAKP
jgi:YVTN family beta-propeller protein